MVRTTCCEKTGLKRGAWTPEEDRKLSSYIKKYGHWNWRELPRYAGLSRCGKSCRLRWVNYLRPDIKRGGYTREEEEIIISLHETLGNRWSAIAAKLPGRTDNEIKNYWHTHLKKRLKQKSIGVLDENKKLQSSVQTRRENMKKKTGLEPAEATIASSFHSSTAAATPTVLESSSVVPSSPNNKLSRDFCASKTDSDDHVLSRKNENYGNNNNSSELFAEVINGSFWTEPFLVADQDFTSTLDDHDPQLVFPLYQVELLGEPLCPYNEGYSDELSMDFWFNNLILAGDLPGIWS